MKTLDLYTYINPSIHFCQQ